MYSHCRTYFVQKLHFDTKLGDQRMYNIILILVTKVVSFLYNIKITNIKYKCKYVYGETRFTVGKSAPIFRGQRALV